MMRQAVLGLAILVGCGSPASDSGKGNPTTGTTTPTDTPTTGTPSGTPGGTITTPPNQAPVVDAGADAIGTVGDAVALLGTASDADGSIASVQWVQVAGPVVALSDPAALDPGFTVPDVASPTLLGFALTATDDDGASATDEVSLTAIPVDDRPPVVDAGPTQVVDEGTVVALAGTASDDGAVTATLWTQTAGPGVTLSDPASLASDFTAPALVAATTLSFALEATDDAGQQATDSVDIVVQPVNLPPTADAGVDQAVVSEDAVGLVGAASDPDGTVTSTTWTQVSGPLVPLSGATTLTPGFDAPDVLLPTVLVFELRVTDDEGAVATDLAEVLVDPLPNLPPTVDAGLDQAVDELSLVSLAGTASDPDGTVVGTTWTQLAGDPVVLGDAASLATDFTAPTTTVEQILLFELEAVDDRGATSRSLTEVRVRPVNQAPTVDAGPVQTVVELATVQLQGSASDADGTIAELAWVQLGGTAVTLSDPTVLDPDFTAPGLLIEEDLVFQLTATDDEGALASDQVTITVQPAVVANQPPDVFAGSDQTVPKLSQTFLAGSATDPDGTVQSTLWTQVEGPAVALTDPTALSTDFVAPDVACTVTLIFELAATDDLGAVATDRVSVTVTGDLATVVSAPVHYDLELDDGGLVTEGSVWNWGPATSGPQSSWNGANVWATNTAGNYANNDEGWLCMPGIDRGGQLDATLSFRMWSSSTTGDAMWVEALDPANGWVRLTDVDPAYDVSNPVVGWGSQGTLPPYALTTVALPDSLPDPLYVRFAFDADGGFTLNGAFLDEIRVDFETDDPDGDGLVGIRDELWTWGTDPFLADGDGDGVDDGTELADGTDPFDVSDYAGRTVVPIPWFEDFELGDGGLVGTQRWEHGPPSHGNSDAHSGALVWGTDLDANYANNARSELYLPELDLTTATDPTLALRLWGSLSTGDAVSVQVHDDVAGWLPVVALTPAMTATDALGQPGWGTTGRLGQYELALVSLQPWVGQTVRVRITLNADGGFTGAGALLDDLAVYEETDDPDGDGLLGLAGEYLAYGTDPFLADTDADGSSDGDEVAAAADPHNPADYPGVAPLLPGDWLDLEVDDGGLATEGESWAWGAVASGPGGSFDGLNGWGTTLGGNYGGSVRSSLYLRPIDLSAAVDPTLSLRVWAFHGSGDATRLEAYDPLTGDWTPVQPDVLPYNGTDETGTQGWTALGYRGVYEFTAFSLADRVGTPDVRLRLRLYASSGFSGPGLYVDEIRLDEESSDRDGDGQIGVIDEWLAGSDPYLADTDDDGALDADELSMGTNPRNPADYPLSPVWTVGQREDLELDDAGLATDGLRWEYGAPGNGPFAGFTGSRVWATSLTGNYGQGDLEYLYLPPVDLTAAVDPSVAFQGWFDHDGGEGTSVEVFDPILGWTHLADVAPAYDATDPTGMSCWGNPIGPGGWTFAGVHLTAWTGQVVQLRLAFRSNTSFVDPGTYLDDFAVDEEGVDHDGDGLIGLLDERALYGTDPTVADTDGDGVDDGTEVGAGTDPLDPLIF